MRIVREISASLRQAPQPPQIHPHTLRKVRCVDYGHGNGPVGVHERRDVDVFGRTAGVDTHRARAGETEVASESPEAGGDGVGVAVEADEGVVAGCVLGAPPLGKT